MVKHTYKILVEAVIEDYAKEIGISNTSEAFESWVNGIILDPYDLSIDEIDTGMTDGGGDGQIDAMFVIANGVILYEDELEIPSKGPIELDIILVQSKNCGNFEENVLRIIRTTVRDLLDLKKGYSALLKNYNEAIQEKFNIARHALLASAGREARIKVRLFYATKGDTSNIHPAVHAAAGDLKNDLSTLATTSDVEIEFLGAAELIELSRRPKTRKRKLQVEQSLTSDTGDSYGCLVHLEALVSFLSDESGALVRSLFDANVRDFLGKTEVNAAIRKTLADLNDDDFWWYNNGITLVSSFVDPKGKTLTLENPLLINGLQTSNVIFSYFTDAGLSDGLREKIRKKIVFVKIVVPPDDTIRDDIIKATNSQTNIPKPYLRGMDNIHRNIEDHMKSVGIFYERRKNQYKNLGKSRSSIVTLSEVAQSLMAAILFRGADARGRPNSLLKSDDDYQMLFSEKYHLNTFRNIIIAKRNIMSRIPVIYPEESSNFRNNIVFHVLSFVSARAFKESGHAAAGWADKVLEDQEIDLAIRVVVNAFNTRGGTDQVAKNRAFGDHVNSIARQ